VPWLDALSMRQWIKLANDRVKARKGEANGSGEAKAA
jgi:hypothetical protein